MTQRFDPEDATFHSMRSQTMSAPSRKDRTIVGTDAAKRLAYASGSPAHVQANPGEVKGWRFDQKDGNPDLRKQANDQANQNASQVHVQGWRFDQKDGNPDLRKQANDQANQNASQVHVQSGYVIRSRGGRKVGKVAATKAPMTSNNMSSHCVQQKRQNMELLVAERARQLK
uniref:Uncharacterized protein n=1 Tax=viral metagenome TaxID=1070528 RepID=A0A6C0CH76_9ZZZZ